jgi:hypothetical protein
MELDLAGHRRRGDLLAGLAAVQARPFLGLHLEQLHQVRLLGGGHDPQRAALVGQQAPGRRRARGR